MFCGSISHAFSCKHETHDLLTLVSSSYYITVFYSHTSPRFGIISPLSESSGRKAASARSAAHRPSVHSCCSLRHDTVVLDCVGRLAIRMAQAIDSSTSPITAKPSRSVSTSASFLAAVDKNNTAPAFLIVYDYLIHDRYFIKTVDLVSRSIAQTVKHKRHEHAQPSLQTDSRSAEPIRRLHALS